MAKKGESTGLLWSPGFDELDHGVSFLDKDGRILRCNPALESLLNTSITRIVGRRCFDLVRCSRENADGCPAVSLKNADPAETCQLDLDDRQMLVTVHPLFDEKGNHAGAFHVMSDITDLEPGTSHPEHKTRSPDVNQQMQGLEQMAGSFAHDISNMLASIMCYAELALRQSCPDSTMKSHVREILTAAQRTHEQTKCFVSRLRREPGKATQTVNRYKLIDEVIRLVAVRIPEDIALRRAFAEDVPDIRADPVKIQQIALNLILNAAEAIENGQGGEILVKIGVRHCDRDCLNEALLGAALPEGLYAYIQVSDTGCGMNGETISQIFNHRYTTKKEGHGIGLSTVLEIVKRHLGAIKVASAPGAGTNITVMLPCA